jgi:ankyrin repeat protein
MSRLTSRAKKFLDVKIRAPHISTASLTTRKGIKNSFTLKTSKTLPSTLTSASDNLINIFNSNSLNNEKFFTNAGPVSRASFQLTSPPVLKVKETSSVPSLPKSTQLHLKLLEDMEKMIPRTMKTKKSMRHCLRTSIRQLNTLKLKPDELVFVNKLIPQTPFGRPRSRIFFQYVKEGDVMMVEQMLSDDKYLAHVFDHIKMTALHWAALRGYLEIAKLLLQSNAFVDALDIVLFS